MIARAVRLLCHTGAGALGASALLLCAGMAAAEPVAAGDTAQANALDPAADHAIFLARVVGMEERGDAGGCEPGDVCLGYSFFDLTLEPVEMIAGNPAIGTRAYRVIQHARYREGITLLVHARRGPDGEWVLEDRTSVELRACLSGEAREAADALDAADSDWSADVEGDGESATVCFSRLLTAK